MSSVPGRRARNDSRAATSATATSRRAAMQPGPESPFTDGTPP